MKKVINIKEIPDDPKRLSVHLSKEQERERELFKDRIAGRKWDPDNKYWTIPYCKNTIRILTDLFPEQYRLDFKIREGIPEEYEGRFFTYTNKKKGKNKKIPKKQTEPLKYPKAIDALEQALILRRYSYATIKSYKLHTRQLFYFYNDKRPSSLTIEDIKAFLLHRIKEEHIKERTQNQAINAIKFFYEKVLKREQMFIDLNRPKVPKDLPNYLSPQEVSRLIQVTENIKHKAIIMTIYSAGLRLSEVINLKVSDIRSDQNYIRIEGGKGKKDRNTLLSPTLLKTLRTYFKTYYPSFYLFEGQYGGKYSKRSVQNIITNAVKKSGIHHATPHTLRHSFATHLVQNGTDITYVKQLLGHGSIKTTEIYLHLSQKEVKNITSPLENLNI